MTTEHIRAKALEHFRNLTRGSRDSETGNGKIWQVIRHTEGEGEHREDHPTVQLSRTAHTDPDGDSMLPDDYRYEFIADALSLIADAESDQDLDELGYEIEAEIYNTNLTRWLGSHLYRASYVDEASAEIDAGRDTFARLTLGNQYEKQFTYAAVLDHIRAEVAHLVEA